ncbi:MAG: serine/threonine-protein kinase [Polyangiaceae bacterium]
MGLHPGALIGANVRLVRPLSRGGMGSVWRAEHLTLHTEVAVKFVSDALIGDAGFLARFNREAVASARIKSPHAVQIFDHGVTADGIPYIVMELLEGEDLRTRLAREKRLPLATTVKVITQVARGLARSHAAEVVHRDIKPGNIFLMDQDGDLFIKILDFGIAKRIGDVEQQVTMTGQIIGTPHYVSPEQIQRPRDADPQNDLWSLAVVAYRCLTSELPFEGESVGAVAIAIDKAAYAPVTSRDPSLPKMLDVWFGRAFSRAVSGRFGTAKEMAAAFEAAAKDEPLPSLPPDSVSLPSRAGTVLSAVARLSPAAPDITPGAVNLRVSDAPAEHAEAPTRSDPPEPAEARKTKPEDRTTRPDVGGTAAPPQTATETPRRADTPLTMHEPTLAHGTVSQIDTTAHPRRTKLYGAAIAAVAIGGALLVGVLSQKSETGATAGPDATASAAATSSARAPTPASASATAALPADPAVTATSAPKPTLAPSASGAPPKNPKKKDRGF